MGAIRDVFRRKPRIGDRVHVIELFEPNGPAVIIDKTYDWDKGQGTDMYPTYLCEFPDGRTAWYNIRCFKDWAWPDQRGF